MAAAMRPTHRGRSWVVSARAHTFSSATDTREIRIGCHLAYVNFFLCFKYITALDVRCIVNLFIVTVLYIHLHSCGCLTLFHYGVGSEKCKKRKRKKKGMIQKKINNNKLFLPLENKNNKTVLSKSHPLVLKTSRCSLQMMLRDFIFLNPLEKETRKMDNK